jgi:hypothetical protein
MTSCGAEDPATVATAPSATSGARVVATTVAELPVADSEHVPQATITTPPAQIETTSRSVESSAPTTTWVPPSISWPTTPYTLPPDYGQTPPGTRPEAPPTETYPPDAVLPSMTWVVDDHMTVNFTPPETLRQTPLPLPAITDFDRANGLYVLERWLVIDEPTFATLSIQANPGPSSPLLSRQEFSESIPTDDLTWYLFSGMAVRQTGLTPNMGLAVSGDYMFMVSGTPTTMRAIIEALSIDA